MSTCLWRPANVTRKTSICYTQPSANKFPYSLGAACGVGKSISINGLRITLSGRVFPPPSGPKKKHESFRFPRLFKVVAPLNGLRKLQAGRGSVQKNGRRVRRDRCNYRYCLRWPGCLHADRDPPIWNVPAWVNQEFGAFKDAGVKPFVTYYGSFRGPRRRSRSIRRVVAGTHLRRNFGSGSALQAARRASLVISGADAAGSNLSDDIGNIFTASQAYVTPTMMFYELYWQQSLLDNALQFRLGRIAAGDTFAALPAFGLQVNGGINGNPLSVFLNSEFYRLAERDMGSLCKIHPDLRYLRIRRNLPGHGTPRVNAYHGLDFSIRSDDGVLILGELGWTPTFGETTHSRWQRRQIRYIPSLQPPFRPPGHLRGGHLLFQSPEEEFLGDGTQQNSYGFYALAQQMLWRSAANPNISFSLWGGATGNPQPEIATMPVMGLPERSGRASSPVATRTRRFSLSSSAAGAVITQMPMRLRDTDAPRPSLCSSGAISSN